MVQGLFSVDGQAITMRDLDETIRGIVRRVRDGSSFCVYTLNLDHVVKRRSNRRFREAYARADVVTADGFPIVLCGLLQGQRVARTTGADLFVPVCAAAAREGFPVFLVGSSDASLAACVTRLNALAPGLDVRGTVAPSHGFDPDSEEATALIETIRASGAKLCFVGLGAPKQEFFAERVRGAVPGVGLLCTGAAGDFVAGVQRRAPAAWQSLGMEWMWRLVHNPRQLFLRYARSFAVLPGLVLESLSLRLRGEGRGTEAS